MAKPFKDLRAKLPAAAQKRATARANVLMQEMPLYELRQARQLSQVQLARELHVGQANVSKIEQRTDVYISTLRSYGAQAQPATAGAQCAPYESRLFD